MTVWNPYSVYQPNFPRLVLGMVTGGSNAMCINPAVTAVTKMIDTSLSKKSQYRWASQTIVI